MGIGSKDAGVWIEPPCYAEVKNEWIYSSIPPYAIMVCTGTTFTFTFTFSLKSQIRLPSDKNLIKISILANVIIQ